MTWLEKLLRRMRSDRVLRRARERSAELVVVVVLVLALALFWSRPFRGEDVLLNVTFDSTRELFREVDAVFGAGAPNGHGKKADSVHAGSVRQLEALARGLVADTVCLASPAEFDRLVARGLVAADWASRWPDGASPFFSTIVFLVAEGNPRRIHDWPDLAREDVRVVVPSPQVSGAGAYAFLALLQDVRLRGGSDPVNEREAAAAVFLRAQILPLGAQQALTQFMRERQGDVFLTWESEVIRLMRQDPRPPFEVVHPPRGILAEPVVALLETHVDKRQSRAAATAYLDFLFGPKGQEIIARHGLRPRRNPDVPEANGLFPLIELVSVPATFGSWEAAQRQHLGPDGTFAWIQRLRTARLGGTE
jgi:sulfate/thiosulfate transport system substrate-binding protein